VAPVQQPLGPHIRLTVLLLDLHQFALHDS
jgi:hypothetical protein